MLGPDDKIPECGLAGAVGGLRVPLQQRPGSLSLAEKFGYSVSIHQHLLPGRRYPLEGHILGRPEYCEKLNSTILIGQSANVLSLQGYQVIGQ